MQLRLTVHHRQLSYSRYETPTSKNLLDRAHLLTYPQGPDLPQACLVFSTLSPLPFGPFLQFLLHLLHRVNFTCLFPFSSLRCTTTLLTAALSRDDILLSNTYTRALFSSSIFAGFGLGGVGCGLDGIAVTTFTFGDG